jgi:hypothetical protein
VKYEIINTEEQMNALAQNPLFWGALIAGLLVLYVLPSVIGAIRKVEGLGWLIVINLIPTGIGWLAAMVMAFALPRREARALYQAMYYYPQPPMQRW